MSSSPLEARPLYICVVNHQVAKSVGKGLEGGGCSGA